MLKHRTWGKAGPGGHIGPVWVQLQKLGAKVLWVSHHLLAMRPADILWPFLITVSQPENLFFPGVNFLKPSPTLQMKLHSYRVRVQGVIIKKRNLLSLRFNMINLKGYYLFLLYASYIHYKAREYGDLAANISPTNENPSPVFPLRSI